MAEIWECTNAEYHADRQWVGASMLKVALGSPGKYRRMFIDDQPLVDPPSESLVLGSAVHCLVLEPDHFPDLFAVRPDVDGRTKEGRPILAKFREECLSKQEITTNLHEKAKAMANAVLAEPLVQQLMEGAVVERGVVWEEDGLLMKCKPDLFIARPNQDSDLILDLKTSDDPTPENWGRGGAFAPVPKWRYDLQAAHYCDGMEQLTGRPCLFGAIVVGKSDPFDVYIYDMTDWMPVGEHFRRAAMDAVKRGLAVESEWRRPEQGTVLRLTPSNYDMEAAR